jgi:20S proteasome subunit alpha 7
VRGFACKASRCLMLLLWWCRTSVGVRCKDGVIIAAEKLMMSKLLVESSGRLIHKLDEHIGVVTSGIVPDGRAVARVAQNICSKYRENYGERITPGVLAEQLADVMYAYTSYAAYRPFGTHVLVCGYDDDKSDHELYLCELDGTFTRYLGTAIGKGTRTAKTEIQKLKITEMSCREALPLVARM